MKYHDPALQEDPPLLEEGHSTETSPRHQQQWLDDVKNIAHMLTVCHTHTPSSWRRVATKLMSVELTNTFPEKNVVDLDLISVSECFIHGMSTILDLPLLTTSLSLYAFVPLVHYKKPINVNITM